MTGGWIGRLIELGEIKSDKGEACLLASPLENGPTMILVIGVGDDKTSRAAAFESAAIAMRKLVDRARNQVVPSR